MPEAPSKVDARGAARAAAEYFRELYPTTRAFSLEEVDLSEDGKHWLVTLSFEIPADSRTSNNVALLFGPPKTNYKVFKVNVRTGDVVSMKIRKFE